MTTRPFLWEVWQGSTLSKRLLSVQSRQDGYTVLRVPKPLRSVFGEIATLFGLYERQVQRAHRTLSAEQREALTRWRDATRELIELLGKETHDQHDGAA